MYAIDKETERLILEADTGDNYDVLQELEHWSIRDLEDVLPSHKSITAGD